MAILRDIKSGMQKKEPTKAVATAEAVQMIRDALPDKPASDITSTDLANAVAYYMGQTTDLNDEGLAMVQNLAKYICGNSVSEKRMSRSNCIYNITSLLNEGAITMEDLEEFSDELKERIRFIAK